MDITANLVPAQRRVGETMLWVPVGKVFTFTRTRKGSKEARHKAVRYEEASSESDEDSGVKRKGVMTVNPKMTAYERTLSVVAEEYGFMLTNNDETKKQRAQQHAIIPIDQCKGTLRLARRISRTAKAPITQRMLPPRGVPSLLQKEFDDNSKHGTIFLRRK